MSLKHGPAPLRAGLYGVGGFGRFLLKSLTDSPAIRIISLGNRTYSRAEEVAREHGVPRVHRSFESLLEDGDLDLVILSTPPAEHGPQTLAALAAGKHVFVEKPQATALDVAERTIEVAAARGLIVAVDYPMPYTPLVEAVTLFGKSRLVGPLLRLSVENIASSQGLGDGHWFWDKKMSGGIFVEHGVHFFDWCGPIAGETQRVLATAAARNGREDRVFAAVEHAAGATASYYHGFVADSRTERTRTVLSFESVDLVLDGWIPTRLRLLGSGAAVATTTIRRMMNRAVASIPDAQAGFIFDAGEKQAIYAQGIRAAVEDMVRSIREPGYIARNDARNAIASLRVAVAARDAARTGNGVDLS